MKIFEKRPAVTALVLILGVAAADVLADGTYDLRFHIESGGGGASESGALRLSGSVGQPVADTSTGGTLELHSGFWHSVTAGVSSVPDDIPDVPMADRLNAPFPNPFNPSTTVSFDLAAPGPVRVRIYDAQGRMIRDLVRAEYPAGHHEVAWDGRNDQGGSMPSGVYFLRFDASGTVATSKMTLLK